MKSLSEASSDPNYQNENNMTMPYSKDPTKNVNGLKLAEMARSEGADARSTQPKRSKLFNIPSAVCPSIMLPKMKKGPEKCTHDRHFRY
jgi:hypothetical protein